MTPNTTRTQQPNTNTRYQRACTDKKRSAQPDNMHQNDAIGNTSPSANPTINKTQRQRATPHQPNSPQAIHLPIQTGITTFPPLQRQSHHRASEHPGNYPNGDRSTHPRKHKHGPKAYPQAKHIPRLALSQRRNDGMSPLFPIASMVPEILRMDRREDNHRHDGNPAPSSRTDGGVGTDGRL